MPNFCSNWSSSFWPLFLSTSTKKSYLKFHEIQKKHLRTTWTKFVTNERLKNGRKFDGNFVVVNVATEWKKSSWVWKTRPTTVSRIVRPNSKALFCALYLSHTHSLSLLLSLSLTLSLTLSFSFTVTLLFSLSLSHIHTLGYTLSLSNIDTHTLFLTHSYSPFLSHTHIYTLSVFLSLSLILSLSLSNIDTHTLSHSKLLSLSLSHTHTMSISHSLSPSLSKHTLLSNLFFAHSWYTLIPSNSSSFSFNFFLLSSL